MKKKLRKPLFKHIDEVVDKEAAIRYTAEEMGLSEEIHAAGYDVESAYSNIAFSPALPESPKLANQLSEGIADLRRRIWLQLVLEHYGLRDWK